MSEMQGPDLSSTAESGLRRPALVGGLQQAQTRGTAQQPGGGLTICYACHRHTAYLVDWYSSMVGLLHRQHAARWQSTIHCL